MAKLTKRLRFEILRRDQFRCRYCGTTAAEAELRVDHVIPEVLGGKTEPSFRYFCGICWRMIEERRETAATLVHLVDDEETGRGA